MRRIVAVLAGFALLPAAFPQDHSFIGVMAVYPSGGAAGTVVEADLRHYRKGVVGVTISGPGVRVELIPPKEPPRDYDWQPQRGYPLFQNRCNGCHDLPNPVRLRYSHDEWAKVVETMIRKHGAPVTTGFEGSEAQYIVAYLGKAAQSATALRARFTLAPDAPPGVREVRMIGKDWVSQVARFEVTRSRELLESGTNSRPEHAQPVPFPAVVNGQLNEARETDWYALDLRKGRRVVLRCASSTLNARHFFPRLRVQDSSGRPLARNEGRGGFDALVDFTAPQDGRFLVIVDDLFSRGSPEMVYRLSVDEAPYEAALFPAGVRRGESVQADLVGEHAEGPPVTLAGSAPGVRVAETPRGRFPFVVGEHPELTLRPGDPVPRTRLPFALNGRLTRPGQHDLVQVEVGADDVGKPFSFEVYGGRIGSPALLSLALAEGEAFRPDKTPLLHSESRPIAYSGRFDTNWPAYKLGADLFGRDERFDVRFPRPGLYALQVWEAEGRSGPGFVYRVHAGPAEADFAVAMTPDNPTVSPGASVFLELHPLRRHGLEGPIEVVFPELPEGLTASRGIIRPGESRSFLVLTAAPEAKPGLRLRTRAVARTTAGGRTLTRPVIPYEFRDHCRTPIAADETLIAVGRPAPWIVTLESDARDLAPGGTLKIRLKVDRRDGKDGDVPLFVFSDHADLRIEGLPTIPAGAVETILKAEVRKGSAARGPVSVVAVNGLNEWIGVTSGAMNRSSAPLQLRIGGPESSE
jgi:hypothetical protein